VELVLSVDLILAFSIYAFVTSITPGPNNTMLLVSGLNFGIARTVPHLLGVSAGFAALVVAIGLGAGVVFTAFPFLHTILQIGGAAYLLYLAWRLATASPSYDSAETPSKPITFVEAATFQLINPKAWVMATGAIAAYVPPQEVLSGTLIITVVYALVNAPCIFAWASLGSVLRNVLTSPRFIRVFNVLMGSLLALSLVPLARELLDAVGAFS
jgi:threonine/homoserine/homoserine lactone efflux protein